MLFNCEVRVQKIRREPFETFTPSVLWIKKEKKYYIMCLKNSYYPDGKTYKVLNLHLIFFVFLKEGRLRLQFKKPEEILYIECQNKRLLFMFYCALMHIVNGKDVFIDENQTPDTVHLNNVVIDHFDPYANEFIAVDGFDNRVLNMRCLSTLVLQDCKSLVLPEEIGHLPIKNLNISGSQMPTSQYVQDIYWNWTSKPTISGTLTTLMMDTVSLKRLPFEILHLKRLQTLSVNNNKLMYLPHFIGELENLKNLFAADNMLVNVPRCKPLILLTRLELAHNFFNHPIHKHLDHLMLYNKRTTEPSDLKSLIHIAIFKLMDNFPLLKRQDIPRSLWEYFNYVGRCAKCRHWTLPNYCNIIRIQFIPPINSKISLTLNFGENNGIPWQSMCCINEVDCEARVRLLL